MQESPGMADTSRHDGDRRALVERVRFGFYLVEPVALQDALELGARAEERGFDLVASCENLFWWNPGQAPVWDCFTVLATLAERTDRLPLMTNVIDPVKRHPAVVAHILATLDNIWPGRFTLGIGPGEVANYGPLVDVSGPPPHRFYTRTREFIEVLRGVWASTQEEPFSFEGRLFQIEDAHLSLKPVTEPHPPIYLAALGERMKRLTGQVADGWTPVIYTPETYAADWAEVASAAEAAGRDPRAIDRALTISTVVLSDEQKARAFGDIVGRVMLTTRPQLLGRLGHSELADERLDVARTASPMDGVQLAQQIPAGLGEQVTICGTPEQAIRRIEEFIAAGVRLFVLWPPYEDAQMLGETIEHYRSTILPYFAARSSR